MEELLNKLIEKGWKPFGRKKTLHITIYDCDLNVYFDWWFMNEDKKSFRELTNKESWLWQFVCENGMQRKTETHILEKPIWESYCVAKFGDWDYKYWLIWSALTDEDKLEDFILDNVKIDE